MLMLIEMGYGTTFVIDSDSVDVGSLITVLSGALHVDTEGYGSPQLFKPTKDQPEIKLNIIQSSQIMIKDGDEATAAAVAEYQKKWQDSTHRNSTLIVEKKDLTKKLESVLTVLKAEKPGKQTKAEIAEMITNAISAGEALKE